MGERLTNATLKLKLNPRGLQPRAWAFRMTHGGARHGRIRLSHSPPAEGGPHWGPGAKDADVTHLVLRIPPRDLARLGHIRRHQEIQKHRAVQILDLEAWGWSCSPTGSSRARKIINGGRGCAAAMGEQSGPRDVLLSIACLVCCRISSANDNAQRRRTQ